jgi:L-lactate dehydrogenase complex protein LldE
MTLISSTPNMPVVQLLHTCLVNEFAPEVGFAVVRVLQRLGFDVQVPLNQTCCGQPAFNAGFQDPARVAARHTISVLERTEGPIVIPSGSCGDMVIHQYENLFRDDVAWRTRAKAVAARCQEFSAFVAQHTHEKPVSGALNARIVYHPSCHLLRGLGIDHEPIATLAGISGIHQVAVGNAEECCGFGGLFSIKHPEISSRLLDRKLDQIIETGADRLVSCDLGCLLHLGGGLHRRGAGVRVQHLAEILDEATS